MVVVSQYWLSSRRSKSGGVLKWCDKLKKIDVNK